MKSSQDILSLSWLPNSILVMIGLAWEGSRVGMDWPQTSSTHWQKERTWEGQRQGRTIQVMFWRGFQVNQQERRDGPCQARVVNSGGDRRTEQKQGNSILFKRNRFFLVISSSKQIDDLFLVEGVSANSFIDYLVYLRSFELANMRSYLQFILGGVYVRLYRLLLGLFRFSDGFTMDRVIVPFLRIRISISSTGIWFGSFTFFSISSNSSSQETQMPVLLHFSCF